LVEKQPKTTYPLPPRFLLRTVLATWSFTGIVEVFFFAKLFPQHGSGIVFRGMVYCVLGLIFDYDDVGGHQQACSKNGRWRGDFKEYYECGYY
jgi:hypothetical protein